MRLYHVVIIIIIGAIIGSCSAKRCVQIIAADNEVIPEAANELALYLTETFPEEYFVDTSEEVKEHGNILLKLTNDSMKKGTAKIAGLAI